MIGLKMFTIDSQQTNMHWQHTFASLCSRGSEVAFAEGKNNYDPICVGPYYKESS